MYSSFGGQVRFYQIMTAERIAIRKNSLMFAKTSPEHVTRVFSHAVE